MNLKTWEIVYKGFYIKCMELALWIECNAWQIPVVSFLLGSAVEQ